MSKIVYKPNLDKFIDSLSPEQMAFLGALIERDIAENDFARLDLLATLMYERVKDMDIEQLRQRAREKFSDIVVA